MNVFNHMSRSSFLFVLLHGSLASAVFCTSTCALGNNIVTTRSYDRSDNLVTKIDTSGYPGLTFTYGVAGYDDNKNPLLETTGGVMAGYSWTTVGGGTANYDAEDRLAFWKRTSGSVSREWPTGANTGLTDVGDWDSVIIDGTTQTRTHDDAHELTAIGANPITLDAKGNTTQDNTKTPNAHNYTWDFDNRMSGASVDGLAGNEIQYTYDALGRRVSKTVPSGMTSTTTVYTCITRGLAESPHAGQVSSEFTANSAASSPLRKYIYGSYIDEPLLLVDLTGADGDATGDNTAGEDYYFCHTNRQFCVTALTDSSAVVIEHYAYTPYGSTVILAPNGTTTRTVSTFSNPYQYTGRRSDPETSLYYYRARYYDVDLGRFTGRDPIGYGDGLNLYAYVGGAVLYMVDPSGHDGEGDYTIIVSGFEPFGDRTMNSSFDIAQLIYDNRGDLPIVLKKMEVNWDASTTRIREELEANKPVKLWLALGEGGDDFRIETTGRNRRQTGERYGDNRHRYPGDDFDTSYFNIPGGPAVQRMTSNFPHVELQEAIQGHFGETHANLNAAALNDLIVVSDNAGGYICDETAHALYSYVPDEGDERLLDVGIFIHVPSFDPGAPNNPGNDPSRDIYGETFAAGIMDLILEHID